LAALVEQGRKVWPDLALNIGHGHLSSLIDQTMARRTLFVAHKKGAAEDVSAAPIL
jgi:hypothetical protein